LLAIDNADKNCPVRQQGRDFLHCPKCGATSSQSCGPNAGALVRLESAVRAAIATYELEHAE
jgi:hypothetical protein